MNLANNNPDTPSGGGKSSSLMTIVGLAQSLYYFVMGVWPLLSMGTYKAVTETKSEDWSVQKIGVLMALVAIVIGLAAMRRHMTSEMLVLAIGSAAALAIVDLVFVGQRVIQPVYLLDAVAQFILIGLWISALSLRKRGQDVKA